jgi:hypothetical protein
MGGKFGIDRDVGLPRGANGANASRPEGTSGVSATTPDRRLRPAVPPPSPGYRKERGFMSKADRQQTILAILLGWALVAPAAAQQLNFTTHTAPVDTGRATALVSSGAQLYLFRSGVDGSNDGQLYVSTTGQTGTWSPLASIVDSLPDTTAGEIYGSAMAYWPTADLLFVSRWRDPSLSGTYPWDKDRVVAYDIGFDEWLLLDGGSNPQFCSGLVVLGDMLYGIQHAGGQPFRRMDIYGPGTTEGTGISGVSGDNATWFSRAAKLAIHDGLIYGIKNDWVTNPRGTGDRLYVIDPAAWGSDNGNTPAVDLGQIPFEVGAGATIVALPPDWSVGGAGALFISAGMSPSDQEGTWWGDDNASDLYAIYDIADGTFLVGHLPGAAGRGTSATFHNDRLIIARGLDESGTYTSDLWFADVEFPDITDLDVTLIERTPRYDFDATPNQPAPGDVVIFHGHIHNHSTHDIDGVAYEWAIDGTAVDGGWLEGLLSGDEVIVTYWWTWQAGDHDVTLTIDPDDQIAEWSELNNAITDRTNGIIVGFWVEQSVYDYFRQYQRELGPDVGSNSWEDWAQRQMAHWNQFSAAAVYPLSPDGILDRVRIDKIVVVPDGALPLGPWGLPTNHPDVRDKTVDMMWGFTADALGTPFYSDHTTVSYANAFYHERSLLHELGHARYLIDCYGFDVHDGQVLITENGVPIAGTPLMPYIAYDSVLYYNHHGGIMTGPYDDAWSPYEAAALNLIAGQRAVCGNYNAPCNIGVFLQDLPDNNHVQLVDRYDRPRANADVRVYRAGQQPDVWYGKIFDDVPDLTYASDAGGYVHLPRNPFSLDQPITHTYGLADGVIIVRVEHAGDLWFRFVEAGDFNMAYWAGNTADAYYTIELEGGELLIPDFNGDGHVDMSDFDELADCLTGPWIVPADGCGPKDLNLDNAVDLHDIAAFAIAFTGP